MKSIYLYFLILLFISLNCKETSQETSSYEKCTTPSKNMVCIHGGKTILGQNKIKRKPFIDIQKHQTYTTKAKIASDYPEVQVDVNTFYMDKFEVTNADFKKCVQSGGCKLFYNWRHRLFNGFHEKNQPAVPVSWKQAFDYCKWAGKRLPTEAEWEKAARGPKSTQYPWGNQKPSCELANYQGCEATTKNVGHYKAGHYGIYEMGGNGYEWVNDWASPCRVNCKNECGASCQGVDPQGPCSGKFPCKKRKRKILKGGSWYWTSSHAQGSWRRMMKLYSRGNRLSFRCASSNAALYKSYAELVKNHRSKPIEAKPPTAKQLQILHNIDEDTLNKPHCAETGWSPKKCKDPKTYVEGNEAEHNLFKPFVKNLGGGYVGVASDANYSLIAYARSQWVWLFDFDIAIVRLHYMLKAFILDSESPSDFIAKFHKKNQNSSIRFIKSKYENKMNVKAMIYVYKKYRAILYSYYKKKSKPSKRFGDFGWLRNPKQYSYIRHLYQQDRISIHGGDMLKNKTMQSIAKSARKLKVIIRIYYPSDAEEHWNFNDNYRQNVANLPFDEKSIALRTIWQNYHSAFKPKFHWQSRKLSSGWHYIIHGGLHYQKTIILPDYKNIDSWKSYRLPTKHKTLSIIKVR